MFTIGGTGIHVHKYIGTVSPETSDDATKPAYTNQSEQNIQDLLFLENRDRKYDSDVYSMRGIYQRQDSDFDLSQFGLFLQTGTIFMVFHIKDMVETIGRRIMSGDVLELEHLKDYDALDQDVPAALKRYYVVGDCSFASEGFTPTWWPHLWRVKLNPLVDSQEYKDILDKIKVGDTDTPISSILSTYDKYIEINDAIIQQAENDVTKSGYDTSPIYHKPLTANGMLNAIGLDGEALVSPDNKVKGYLTGDGLAPNGLPVGVGISFPAGPAEGDYFLRTDYLPNRLFRYNGARWIKIEDAVRTGLTPNTDENKTLRSSFTHNVDNTGNLKTYTDSTGTEHYERQSLSKALTPKADN